MYKVRAALLLLCVIIKVNSQERITSFMSNITIQTDGILIIKEEIDVMSEGFSIVHGIVREIPTCYRGKWGEYYNVEFKVLSISCDGQPVPFRIESVSNGKKIYIGDKNVLVPCGKHSYVIIYETNRHIGFFEDHDELYWNVTGNGWRLPIDSAQAYVQLPQELSEQSIGAEAYTGYQEEQGNNYIYSIKNNCVSFSTKQGLARFEGMTIVVTFPKGCIIEPYVYQKVWWFCKDNFLLVILIFSFIVVLLLLIIGIKKARKKNRSGTIIPLFYPPKHMLPSDVGYMNKMQFDNTLLSADIINLAVQGFITITYTPNKLWGGKYTLNLKNIKNVGVYNDTLIKALFSKKSHLKDQLIIPQKNNEEVLAAVKKCQEHTTRKYKYYIVTLKNFLYLIQLISVAMILLVYVFRIFPLATIATIFYFLLFILTFSPFFKKLFLFYTPEGRKIQDEIEGFKLYLTTAEINQMHMVGTPPTKTPELYETYLPYAIALGVEQQWTNQFSSLFKNLEKEGHAYTPSWYHGRTFRVRSFGYEMGKSFTRTISSASNSPGRSSGSGGRGYSGGGGGGGGGGGW